MRRATFGTAVAAIVLAATCGSVLAQQKTADFGKREYEANCASCHGLDGKGNGPLVELLRRSPPDLTVLAKNNQGILPTARMYEVIDGANVPSHGTRDMPVWGRDYRVKDAEHYVDVPYDAEALVRARILALVEYLNRLQVR